MQKEQFIHINAYGSKFYYSDRALTIHHREDGPAVEWCNGDKAWYINGKRHREDGPAIEYNNGDNVWYINGKKLSEVFNSRLNPVVELTLEQISEKFNIPLDQLRIKD